MSKAGIYAIVNTINNRAYIGSTCNPKARIEGHKHSLIAKTHHCKGLQEDWNKFGAHAFDFEILERCANSKLSEREEHWMKNHHALTKGYNIHKASVRDKLRYGTQSCAIITLYLDEKLKSSLQARAKSNRRSLTAEAALIIKTAMEEP